MGKKEQLVVGIALVGMWVFPCALANIVCTAPASISASPRQFYNGGYEVPGDLTTTNFFNYIQQRSDNSFDLSFGPTLTVTEASEMPTCSMIMQALGHHGKCDDSTGSPVISCTGWSAAALNAAIQPPPSITILTIAVATSLMAATSMFVALAWFFNWKRRQPAPIYDNETGDEALLGAVN